MQTLPPKLEQIAGILEKALSARPARLDITSHSSRPASVFMPLCWHRHEAHVLFTKRTDKLYHHGGQISFPGGSQDPGDPNPAYAAMRETFEELGVTFERMRIIMRMDQQSTITGFRITPFLGLLHPAEDFKLNHHEVERLIMVPLAKVLNINCYREEEIIWQGAPTYWTALNHEGDIIWGATARILLTFISALKEVGLDYKIALDSDASDVY